ncbi:MAG: Rieske 2Fe-2S domain-containing protein [Acidobacteria bacterium]|jgi:nitrite reductase/ring-hydroxylating ferredoxin subunit/Fe-S cluster biogenesis protein NfuA|nr:Rieske 2Fe-2S domain-containing protein [Acidobacteriota bacterium]
MTEATEITEETTAFDQLNILLESIEQHPEEAVRNHVRALVYTLLDLHHGALQRIVEIVSAQPEGEKILEELSGDELVQAVLMVHELMAQPLETRIENALEIARQQLKIYGADVELVEVKNGVAQLKLFGGASTANVSTTILKAEIEHALHEHTPDLLNVEYEDLIAPSRPVKLVQILPRRIIQDTSSPTEFYMPIIRADQVPDNKLRVVETGGINLLLCNVAGTIYVFQNHCAEGNLPLDESILEDGILTCSCHGYQFDARQKGRCLSDPDLRLEALPMRVENEIVKVALPKEV